MLQSFLKNNLITLTDDPQLEKLKKTSQELVKRIKKDKSRIYSFVLAGIDPNIPAGNHEIKEIKEIFEKTWPTYTAVTRETPIPFIRAVILHALVELSSDINIADLIYLSTRNIIQHLTFSPHEEVAISEFVSTISLKISPVADDKFRIRYTIKNSLISIEGIRKTLIEETVIKKALESDYGDGTLITFIPKVVKSYTTAINRAHLDISTNLEIVSSSINALGLKTELIWWKTSAYSPLLKQPYKLLAPPVLDIALAVDYSDLIPFIFPESVNYFLMATHEEITSENDSIILTDFFKSLDVHGDILTHLLPEQPISNGRMSLLDFTIGLIYNKISVSELEAKVGISSELSLKRSALTTWLFHDVQCHKILGVR